MKKIGLLSDTHSFLDERILPWLEDRDEIWHAGDIGSPEVADRLESLKPFRAVYGNIDGQAIRQRFPLDLRFNCEGLDVFITHIGGYPGRYNPRARAILKEHPPNLFICGHSHILKVMPDKQSGFLHINPGACGNEGFHKVKTIVRFEVADGKVGNLEVVEILRSGVWGLRSEVWGLPDCGLPDCQTARLRTGQFFQKNEALRGEGLRFL